MNVEANYNPAHRCPGISNHSGCQDCPVRAPKNAPATMTIGMFSNGYCMTREAALRRARGR